MPKTVPITPSAPSPLGPYSLVTEVNGLLFFSGQVGLDPKTGERAPDDVYDQTHRVMKNIEGILGDVGLEFSDVVKTTVFMADINDYQTINDVYGEYFTGKPPARSAIQAGALPGGFLVEIEVVAAR